MPATIRDISRKANVSAMTVSRVLNPGSNAYVAPETRERILTIARELDYTANHMARALVTGRTRLIALALPRIAGEHNAAIAATISRLAREDGYDIVLQEMNPKLPAGGSQPPVRQYDGALLVEDSAEAADSTEVVGDRHAPLIRIGPADGADITIDLYPAARTAVEHLVQGGRHRIACCMQAAVLEAGIDARLHAFAEVMEEAGRTPEYIAVESATRLAARRAFREYVLRADFPDAVFCESDEIALGIHRGAHIMGLIVPGDLFLTGCDDIEESEYHIPSISTIRWPVEEICRTAWQMLRRRIDDPSAPVEPMRFTAEFVARESSR